MPVKLIHEAADVADDFDVLTQTGELTLEAETVSDFLTHADFSAVFNHPAVKECISTIAGGKIAFGAKADQAAHREALSDLAEGEDDAVVQVISVEDALKVIDESDLEQMFLHYVESLPENTLEDRARRAAIANYYGIDEKKGGFKKGGFRTVHGKPGGPALVNRMLGAMLNKGLIKRADEPGTGYKKGDYEKTKNYKTGATKAAKAKVAKFKKANAAKLKRQAAKAKAAKKRKLAASMGMESMAEGFEVADLPVFGFGLPVDGAMFEVGTVGNVSVGESTEGSSPARASVLSEGARLVAGMNRVSQRING